MINWSKNMTSGVKGTIEPTADRPTIFTENTLAYSLYKHCDAESRLFFKFHHNMGVRQDRTWYYYCAPDVDVIEVRIDGPLVAYELKGARRHQSGADYPAFYDAIGQAIAYLDLPGIFENDQREFDGGAFDAVYAVCARETPRVYDSEVRILSTVPIGGMIALPDGQLFTVKEAPKNPIQNIRAKEHFLKNLDTLNKHTTQSRIFHAIEDAGNKWFCRPPRSGPST
ncbi:hypothetical protein [Candidatus Binatus sp.]|uniref:hypothetical protein n=1 Tax=Candidatus Binatus sp. TaxID=2811406 RepID=UPI003C779EBF